MAVRAAFPGRLYFPAYPSLLTKIFFRFFPSCSYTVFALPFNETSDMPRTKASSAVPEDHFVLVLPSLGYDLPRLGPWAPMNKRARGSNHWAPQQPLKILLSDLLVGEEGFDNAKPLLRLV